MKMKVRREMKVSEQTKCVRTVNDFVQFHLWWLNDRWRGTQTGQRDKALKQFSKVSMCMTEVVCLLEINIPTCQWKCPLAASSKSIRSLSPTQRPLVSHKYSSLREMIGISDKKNMTTVMTAELISKPMRLKTVIKKRIVARNHKYTWTQI